MKTYRVLPNRNDPMVSLKMSAEMLDDLSLAAKKNGRSLNHELLVRLAVTMKKTPEYMDSQTLLQVIFRDPKSLNNTST